ncbi:MAG: hypothetical protein COA99_18025 [Moraxellaceae bacterium]|nr:MAG: hypothetical protein COA99_18025 [Moraxellaceae bacterium]
MQASYCGPLLINVENFSAGTLINNLYFPILDFAHTYVYSGETEDDEVNLIETNDESAWRAGLNNALPGYIMLADPTVGFEYYQEFVVEDDAIDLDV